MIEWRSMNQEEMDQEEMDQCWKELAKEGLTEAEALPWNGGLCDEARCVEYESVEKIVKDAVR